MPPRASVPDPTGRRTIKTRPTAALFLAVLNEVAALREILPRIDFCRRHYSADAIWSQLLGAAYTGKGLVGT